jgi:pyruvate/2-oxoglutarate dehydrogenase complex dihydrolipoamide dehydrogenase (E3) component
LDFPGAELALTHSDVWALRELPKSVVVVGAAATGCQLASIFADFGVHVTLLERSERILRFEDQAVSTLAAKALEVRSITCITGIDGLLDIQDDGKTKTLRFERAGKSHSLETEAVILSAGWVGNLTSLNLAAAGVETDGPYVRVNDYLQSSAPHIFAAGDITGRMMLVQSAGSEALAAAENAVLGVGMPQRHTIVPHGGFTDPEYGSVGLTEEQARAVGEVFVAQVDYRELDRAVIDGRTQGMCKLIVAVDDHRIVGAHVVGEQALEVVHIAAVSMMARMMIEQLADLQIAYPTYTAVIGLAARKVVRQLGVTPLSPEWRSLERKLQDRQLQAEWELRIY